LCYHTSLARSADYLEKRFQAKFEQRDLFEPIYHHSGFSAPLHPVIANESTGEVRNTFSIITTTANPLLERIHNTRKRMPVILRRDDEKKYLEKDLGVGEIDAFLKPYDDKEMQAHTISGLISTKNANTNVPEVMSEFIYEGLDP